MSQAPRSRTAAGILNQSRRRTGTKIPRPTRPQGTGPQPSEYLLYGPYGRVRAALMRVKGLLDADEGLSLPQVSVNDLERALSVFQDECRLGLPREGTPSTPTRGYGHKLITELKDPELAERVRKNRAEIREKQAAELQSRRRH